MTGIEELAAEDRQEKPASEPASRPVQEPAPTPAPEPRPKRTERGFPTDRPRFITPTEPWPTEGSLRGS